MRFHIAIFWFNEAKEHSDSLTKATIRPDTKFAAKVIGELIKQDYEIMEKSATDMWYVDDALYSCLGDHKSVKLSLNDDSRSYEPLEKSTVQQIIVLSSMIIDVRQDPKIVNKKERNNPYNNQGKIFILESIKSNDHEVIFQRISCGRITQHFNNSETAAENKSQEYFHRIINPKILLQHYSPILITAMIILRTIGNIPTAGLIKISILLRKRAIFVIDYLSVIV